MASRGVNVIAVLSALVLIGSQAGLYQTTSEKDRAARWVSHTYEVIGALTATQTGLLSAEAALRGYAITHEASLLPEFNHGLQQVRRGSKRARELTIDNPHAHQQLRALEPKLTLRLSQLEESLELARAFSPPSQVTSLERIRLGLDIRGRLVNLVQYEQELLNQRLELSADETQRAQITAIAGALLALGLSALIFAMIRRQNLRLREAEEELRLTVDSAPAGIALIAADGSLLRVNDALVRIFGADRSELLRADPYKLFGAVDVRAALSQAQRLVANELQTHSADVRALRVDGAEVWLHITVSLVRSTRGEPRFFVCQVEDISDRKGAEAQAQLLSHFTRAMAEAEDISTALASTLDMLCESQDWDYAECWTVQAQPAELACHPVHFAREASMQEFHAIVSDLRGVPPNSLIGRVWATGQLEWHEDLHDTPDSQFMRRKPALELGLRACIAVPLFNEDRVEGVLVLLRRALSPRDARLQHVLSVVGGQLGMYIQRKRAQEALRASEARLNLASQATSDVIYDWNLCAKTLWLGEALERNFGHASGTLTAEWRASCIHPEDRAAVDQTLAAAVSGEQSHWVAQYRWMRADQSYAHVLDRGMILRDTSGTATRVIGSMMDVSERVRSEDALREAKNAAEAAAQAKTSFLANMSHEIRTPLTALLGFADLMLEPSVGESDRVNYAMTIRRNGEHLLSVLNDILDVSMIEAGKLSLEMVDFAPRNLLSEVASLMKVRALEKALEFEVQYENELPDLVRSDPTRVRQVALNLLSNAVKFCERGSVRLQARCIIAEPGRPSQLVLRVHDTGIGMWPSQVQRIFEPFAQADASTSRRFGGSGLGLAICARLASALGGKLEVESTPQVGSTFTFTVPVEVLSGAASTRNGLSEPAPSRTHQTVVGTGRVLLAEDGPDNQVLISALLRGQGIRVSVVGNGALAVEQALAAADSGKPYDLILMDMQMPELDGYGAARKLRQAGYGASIVALTAHAMAGERERCLAAGCDEYLTKPIRKAELIQTVHRHIQAAQDARAHTSSPWAAGGLVVSTAPPPAPALTVAPGPANENATAIVSLYAGDSEIGTLVQQFVKELPERVQALGQAAEHGDRVVLARLAHQLTGAAGGFGFPSITRAAKQLELLAREGAGPCDSALAELAALCARARAA